MDEALRTKPVEYKHWNKFQIGDWAKLKTDCDAGNAGDYVRILGDPQGADAYNPFFPVSDRPDVAPRLARHDNLEVVKLDDPNLAYYHEQLMSEDMAPATADEIELESALEALENAIASLPSPVDPMSDHTGEYHINAFECDDTECHCHYYNTGEESPEYETITTNDFIAGLEEQLGVPVSMMPKLYISGPMTGIPEYNYPAFNRAARALRWLGYDVVNPAQMDEELGTDGLSWQNFLARDISAILLDDDVEGVALIDGWRNSRGATLEAYIAQQAGKKVYALHDPEDDTPWLQEIHTISVAYAAQSIVLGARRFQYGHPLDNFLKIAELFNATIGHKLTEPLDIRDVAMLMVQVKIAREYNVHTEDNLVDIGGYILALSEALNEMEARGGDMNAFLSDNAALLRQHSALGADSER